MADLRVFAGPDELAAAVAVEFLQVAGAPVAGKPGPQVHEVALTGGSISRVIHREIARLAQGDDSSWHQVRFWWGDERFVLAASEDRNAFQATVDLLDTLMSLGERGLPVDNIIAIPAADEISTVEASADAYADLIRREGTGEFEVVMLGVGPDGHCASLFPGHPAVGVTDAITVAVDDSPKPPPERVSLTFEALNRSRRVWFVVSGADKADAVRRALAPAGEPGATVAETPARGLGDPTYLRPGDPGPQITWWLDSAAAADLPQ